MCRCDHDEMRFRRASPRPLASRVAARDAEAQHSTAILGHIGPMRVPGVADEPPPGRVELLDDRGVYVRRFGRDPAGTRPAEHVPGPDAWYVHGLAGSSANWTSLAGLMSPWATGYAVDLPGHGRSDPPPAGRYSIRDNADLVAALIRRRSGRPVHLVGNSLGGVVSTALAARHPELVATLTLISPAVPDFRFTRDRGANPVLAILLVPGTGGPAERRLGALGPMARARGMGSLCYGDPDLLSDSDYRIAATELAWRASLPWAHASTIGSLRALLRSYLRRSGSFRADARTVRVPTLVIWGTRDALIDVRLAGPMARWFDDSSLLILPGVGHTAQMENPMATARALVPLWLRAGAPHAVATRPVATSEL